VVLDVRYYIETYGCAANRADELVLKEVLRREGWLEVGIDEADVIVLNTCGVKKPTEDRMFSRLSKLSSYGKPIVVAGCLPRINPNRLFLYEWSVALDPSNVHKIAEGCRLAIQGARHLLLERSSLSDKPAFISMPLSGPIGVIEIQEGCNLACSFCATRFARGRVVSFPPGSIIRALKEIVKKGAWEVWFTGQDVAAYGYDGIDLPKLLDMVASLEEEFMIRVGMMTPIYAKRVKNGLAEVLGRKVFRFVHLPVQSGSDKMLKVMARGHKVDLFYELVDFFRSKVENLTLATDIIVGHPGEEEEDFELTVRMLEKTKPDVVNLSKYGDRPGTPASKMKKLPSHIVAKRSRYLYGLILELMKERNEKWIGWEGSAVVTQRGTKKGTWMARNFSYKPIVIKSDGDVLGARIDVLIEGARTTHLVGRLLANPKKEIKIEVPH